MIELGLWCFGAYCAVMLCLMACTAIVTILGAWYELWERRFPTIRRERRR